MSSPLQVHDVRLVPPGHAGPCLVCGLTGGFVTGAVTHSGTGGAIVAQWVACANGPGEMALVLTVGDPALRPRDGRDTFTLLMDAQSTSAVDPPDGVIAAAAADRARFGRALLADESLAHPLGQSAIEVMQVVYLGVPEIHEHVLGTGDLPGGTKAGEEPVETDDEDMDGDYPEPMLGSVRLADYTPEQ